MVGYRRCAQFPPRHFSGVFIETDLADQNQTYALAKDLAARGDVFGIVNNVGLVRRETIDAVDFEVFTGVMDLNVAPGVATHPGSSAQHAIRSIWTHHQRHQPRYSRAPVCFKLCGSKSSTS